MEQTPFPARKILCALAKAFLGHSVDPKPLSRPPQIITYCVYMWWSPETNPTTHKAFASLSGCRVVWQCPEEPWLFTFDSGSQPPFQCQVLAEFIGRAGITIAAAHTPVFHPVGEMDFARRLVQHLIFFFLIYTQHRVVSSAERRAQRKTC